MQGLERWKARHPEVAAALQPADVMVDPDARPLDRLVPDPREPPQRPEDERPPQEALEVDYDPVEGMDVEAWRRRSDSGSGRPESARGAGGHRDAWRLGCCSTSPA